MEKEKSCGTCRNNRKSAVDGKKNCPLTYLAKGKKSKVCGFFTGKDAEKVIRIGYDDGHTSDLNIIPEMEFVSFNAGRIYLAIYLKNHPDEKSKNYFLHKVKTEVKQ